MPQAKTAILIFSRTPREEARIRQYRKDFGVKQNQKIAEEMVARTIQTANRTRLPVFIHYRPEQQGNTFGERLANAFENVFSKGYSQVLAIGTDCPELDAYSLIEARDALYQNGLVVGADQTGGNFLIGLRKSTYTRGLFLALPWNTQRLNRAWKSFAETLGTTIHVLADKKSTAIPVLAKMIYRLPVWLKQLIALLVAPRKPIPCLQNFNTSTFSQRAHGYRGPPV